MTYRELMTLIDSRKVNLGNGFEASMRQCMVDDAPFDLWKVAGQVLGVDLNSVRLDNCQTDNLLSKLASIQYRRARKIGFDWRLNETAHL